MKNKLKGIFKFPMAKEFRGAFVSSITFVTNKGALITMESVDQLSLSVDDHGYIYGIGKDIEFSYDRKIKDYISDNYGNYQFISTTRENIIGYAKINISSHYYSIRDSLICDIKERVRELCKEYKSGDCFNFCIKDDDNAEHQVHGCALGFGDSLSALTYIDGEQIDQIKIK